MVELNGFETNENDYFTIQCGPTFGSDDILDAVAPNFLNSIYAEVDFYDLTYMRCDYIFTYVHFDYIGDVTIMQKVDLEIPSEDHPTTPKQPHLIYAGNPSTMKVMYVSSLTKSTARYWKSDDSEDPGNSSSSHFFTVVIT